MKRILIILFGLLALAGCEEAQLRSDLASCQSDLALEKRTCEAQIKDIYADAQRQLDDYIKRYADFTDEQDAQIQEQAQQIALLEYGLREREEAIAHKKYCDFFGIFAIFCDKEKAKKAQEIGHHTFNWRELSKLALVTILIPIISLTIPIFAFAHYRLSRQEKQLDEVAERLAADRENLLERESYYTDLIKIAESKTAVAEVELSELNQRISQQKDAIKAINREISDKKSELATVKQEVKAKQELKEAIKNIADF